MSHAFYIVGPTASGKSELAVQVAERCGVEILNADAFQLYGGMSLLTAQPDGAMLARVSHHFIGSVDPAAEMSANAFADAARPILRERDILVASGSGLYVRALTEGLARLPVGDPRLRERLAHFSLGELNAWLRAFDAKSAAMIDRHNRRRVERALEICVLTGKPASQLRTRQPANARGVFVFRDRDDLHERINSRVLQMFAHGVVDEVKQLGVTSRTAGQTIGLHDIRQLIAGEISKAECITRIQQATRRYAKRQLTWFRRQTNFEPLNLSQHSAAEAVEWIAQRARLCFSE